MAITALQITLALVLNAIPLAGLTLGGWSPASALFLYWFETFLGSILIALRIALHRRWTRKRGHSRPQFGATVSTNDGPARPVGKTFLGEFLVVSLAFSIAHGIFLGTLFLIILKTWPVESEIRAGLPWMASAQLATFFLDLSLLRNWSFAQLKARASNVLGRLGLIHFTIMGGMLFTAISSRPQAIFVVFGALKSLADIATRLPFRVEKSEEPPSWVVWILRKTGNGKHWKTGQDIDNWWRQTTRAELKQDASDEAVIPVPCPDPKRSKAYP